MNHARILKHYLSQLESKRLRELADLIEQQELAGPGASNRTHKAAHEKLHAAVNLTLERVSELDLNIITQVIQQEVRDEEAPFKRFQASRRRYNLHELVNQGNNAAARFMEQTCAPNGTEVWAYQGGEGAPSLFLSLRGKDQVALHTGDTPIVVHVGNRAMLERALFDWGQANEYFS